MKQKIWSLALALVLLLSLALPVVAVTANDARNSVVVVSTLLATDAGNVGFGHGSGFFVSDQYLVTNHHVIEDFEQYGAGELITMTADGATLSGRAKIRVYYDSGNYEEAFLVGSDSRRDVAILRLSGPTDQRVSLQLKVPTDDMVGSTVYAVGFPGLADNIVADATSSWSKNDSTVTSGTISRMVTQSGTGQRNVQIDCDIKHGNSGGPVIDETGAVIGIATWGVSNNNESVNYAVNIEDAMMLMDQYRVPYTMAGESAQTGSAGNLAFVIGIAAAVLIAASVIAVILRRKKQIPAPAVPAAPQKVPTVRSLAQVNYGSRAPVSGQPVLIGRSGACGLRFPNETPGVSGSHCTVQWDTQNGDFIVMDLNSTYGTFLMSGQKLSPNVPYHLRPGDRFYLADQNNTIALELE